MAKILSAINYLINVISSAVAKISVVAISLVTLIMTTDVIMRYFFNSPFIFSIEICEFLLCLIVFLSLSYTFQMGGHIRVDLVIRRLHPGLQYWVRTATLGIASLYLFILTCQLVLFNIESYNFNRKSTVILFPIWIPQLAMVAGGLILNLVVIVTLVFHWSKRHDRTRMDDQY
jgi:C4-dicarboxylate transporter DctQ subunit